jgi:hypothetical protein
VIMHAQRVALHIIASVKKSRVSGSFQRYLAMLQNA